MPNLSFCGHLAGIVTGTLHLHGLLDFILVTDESFLQEMDTWKIATWLSSLHPGFVPTPASIEMTVSQRGSLGRTIVRGFRIVWSFLGNVVETAVVIVFGRGSGLNGNIQLRSLMTVSSNVESVDDEDYDEEDEWVGLPETRAPSQLV